MRTKLPPYRPIARLAQRYAEPKPGADPHYFIETQVQSSQPGPAQVRKTYWQTLGRSLALRCPVCGFGQLFDGWFRMRKQCDFCGYSYQREPGYFLGSIYVNYGLTALLVTAGYFVGFLVLGIRPRVLLWSLVAFCVVFPLWFFRYARSFWMGFDTYWDPVPEDGDRLLQPDEGENDSDRADWR